MNVKEPESNQALQVKKCGEALVHQTDHSTLSHLFKAVLFLRAAEADC